MRVSSIYKEFRFSAAHKQEKRDCDVPEDILLQKFCKCILYFIHQI